VQCPGCGVVHVQPHAEAEVGQLQNIGEVSAAWLRDAGIHTSGELAAIGAAQAYLRVEALGVKPSLNLLYALEGAISGTHWLETKRHSKAALLLALETARERRQS
jgi:DNA transformation protein